MEPFFLICTYVMLVMWLLVTIALLLAFLVVSK